jgi:hypothetical protein
MDGIPQAECEDGEAHDFTLHYRFACCNLGRFSATYLHQDSPALRVLTRLPVGVHFGGRLKLRVMARITTSSVVPGHEPLSYAQLPPVRWGGDGQHRVETRIDGGLVT